MRPRTPLISVLIDTYNYGRFVEEAIDSALTQDFPAGEREILLIDDGSTDDTEERVRKFGRAITYLRKPNGGQASAFNFGLRHARGKYVAFLDADDYWLPGKLSRVTEEFEKHPDTGMVYHGLRQLNSREGRIWDARAAEISGFLPAKTRDLLRYTWFPTSFLAFRRSALDLVLPIPESLTIQADAHLSALIVFVAPIVALPEFLAVYRVHGSNLFANSAGIDPVTCEQRTRTRGALIDGVKRWLCERSYDMTRPDLRMLMKHWEVMQEEDAFLLHPPNRWNISRHLMRYALYCGPQLGRRHRVVTYLNAAGSLVVGYQNLHKLDEWRVAITHSFGRNAKRQGVKMT
ncbi:MAG TPA: glycosyltransferase [Candidatus Acidoferrum sp.]|jgi:glycosyltransferase involved in cell wall biosynthesis